MFAARGRSSAGSVCLLVSDGRLVDPMEAGST